VRRCVAYLMFFALAIALVGSVKGQDSGQNKVEFIKYPVPGSEDATGEIQTPEDRELLNDFYQSRVQEQLHQAVMTNDAAKFAPLLADQMTWVSERFGKGIILTKAQVLDDFRSSTLHVNTQTHNHVRLVVVGSTTIVVTGMSYSNLTYQGKVSKGPRMFAEVWVKLDGRWQMVAHHVSDVERM
jgi:hypothetical protein